MDARNYSVRETLKNGLQLTIRAIRPDDRGALRTAFRELDKRTIHLRFFGPKKELSDRAEVAFTVEEDYQGLGIASRILRHLAAIAGRMGISQFHAEVLPENTGMLAVFARSGFPVRQKYSERVVHSDPFPLRRPAVKARWGFPLAVLALLLLSACGGPAKGPESAQPPGEWRTFEGTGTATGHRQTLHLGPGRKVSIVNLTGSMVLVGERGLGQGFRSEVLGYVDSATGGTAWSVWTDSRGDQVFGEFRGGQIGTRSRFTGTLLGGTGRFAGITGEYEFEWQYVVDEEDGSIQGRITSLRGRFRQDASSPSPPGSRPGSAESGRPRP